MVNSNRQSSLFREYHFNWAFFTVKSGVNFLDLSVRQGQFPDLPKLPFVPGFECAGDVVLIGPNTSGFQVNC